jgi:hypothetical protein
MIEEEQKPDLHTLAAKIVKRLGLLTSKSDDVSAELAVLTAKIRAAIEADDVAAQWALLDEIKVFLAGSMETREEIRNVFHMFHLYVYVRNSCDDGLADDVWWVQVAD